MTVLPLGAEVCLSQPEWLAPYLTYLATQRRAAALTLESYQRDLLRLSLLAGARPVTELTSHDIRRFAARLHAHFGKLTRAVVDVPYDRTLVGATPLEFHRLNRQSREAWLRVAGAVAEGL